MQKIHIIGGPTASGKSARALEIAEKKGGVIINADAMQVYRELPILTAQPNAAEQAHIPHRLYGVIAHNESCSAGIWAAWAEREIKACWSENALPIIVGGTGLYLKALIEGFSPMPDVSAEVRQHVADVWDKLGAQAFHALLLEKDSVTAQRLEINDRQRHVRALEVLEATGKPLSHWQSLPRQAPFARECFDIGIVELPREELYRRCDLRFSHMLEAGVLEEVRHANISSSPLSHALGFKELAAHLAGKMSLEQAVEKARQATRNYAKRQMTWFRHQLRNS